jgi:hypothetical protein
VLSASPASARLTAGPLVAASLDQLVVAVAPG